MTFACAALDGLENGALWQAINSESICFIPLVCGYLGGAMQHNQISAHFQDSNCHFALRFRTPAKFIATRHAFNVSEMSVGHALLLVCALDCGYDLNRITKAAGAYHWNIP